MLIGFNLAPVVANIYWPQDQWVALIVMTFAIVCAVALKGFLGRISIFLSLVFGYLLSWLFDRGFGQITSFDPGAGKATTHWRVNLEGVASSPWFGFPPSTMIADGKEVVGMHAPTFSIAAVSSSAGDHRAHRREHRPRQGRRRDDRRRPRPVMGRAIAADGVAHRRSPPRSAARPTTTYAENIGVMAASRVYSTAAYYVAALIAIIFGLSPKFGALVAATPVASSAASPSSSTG
jgi:xanthine/uracil permease